MKIINRENFVDKAEQVIRSLDHQNNDRGYSIKVVTTSQIRNLLSMTSDLYNEVMLLDGDVLDSRIKERISYLRVRCIYEAGRDDSVKVFIEKSGILDILSSIQNRSDYILFSRYMESLVAWHKYCHGKDA